MLAGFFASYNREDFSPGPIYELLEDVYWGLHQGAVESVPLRQSLTSGTVEQLLAERLHARTTNIMNGDQVQALAYVAVIIRTTKHTVSYTHLTLPTKA